MLARTGVTKMRRLTDDQKRMRGTLRPHRIRATTAYKTGEKLTQDQEILLDQPGDWPDDVLAVYRDAVINAPWLQAAHRPLLTLWAAHFVTFRTASAELAAAMADSVGMAAPGSATARAALLYSGIAADAERIMAQAAKLLGFTPAARERLGIVLA
jgi:hypothetical protein